MFDIKILFHKKTLIVLSLLALTIFIVLLFLLFNIKTKNNKDLNLPVTKNIQSTSSAEIITSSTLQDLGGDYSKNNDSVYYRGTKIDADFNTFYFITSNVTKSYDVFNVAADKNSVFVNGSIEFKNLDTPSFEWVNTNYVKDKFGVYINSLSTDLKKIVEADPATFVDARPSPITVLDAEDKNYLYFSGEIIMKKEAGMKYLDYFYSKNNVSVFYKNKIIIGADLSTFKSIGADGVFVMDAIERGYAKDKKHVYMNGKVIIGADPATFVSTDRVYYWKDKNNQYLFGEKIKNDFVSCATSTILTAEERNFWSKKLSINIEKSKFEFCNLPDGSKLVGYQKVFSTSTESPQIKLYDWFDKNNKLINNEPAKLDCWSSGPSQIPGSVLDQSIDTLDNQKVKVDCALWDACSGKTIYLLDLIKMSVSPKEAITSTSEYYDCGYRG